jgi:ribosomal protein S18 acetylase RimI-like enzyme
MDQVVVRPARPEDVDVAVPLIYSSGPNAFDYVFEDAVRFLRHAYLDGAGEFGYRNHTVAQVGGQVIGIGAAYSADTALAFTAAAARQILRHYNLRGPGAIVRGLRVERVIRPPAEGMLYLAHLGVVESMRGRGIGSTLVRRFLDEGRQLGRRTAELDVAVTNPGAQRLYERLGFQVTLERPSTLRNAHGSVSNHCRMVLTL